jgi:Cytochrome c, mono- and diheme variants
MKNEMHSLNWFPILTLFTLMVSGCASASITPAAVKQSASTGNASISMPLVAPSITDGENTYRQYCASCHTQSDTGSSLAQRNIKNIQMDWLQKTLPLEMYTYLGTGSPQKGMPSFSSLSINDRWDLVAYLLSLVAPQNALSSGELIYQNMCQSCHGINGAGDGAQATAKGLAMINWQNNPLLTDYSNDYLYNSILSGNNHGMSDFAVMLNEAQIWSLVTTVRAFSITAKTSDQGLSDQDQVTTASPQNEGYFTIVGNISNGSGGELNDLKGLNLIISNAGQELYNMTGTANQSGSFAFVQVPFNPDWTYAAEVTYAGLVYRSNTVLGMTSNAGDSVPLTIRVYDSSADISYLRGERLHVLLNFAGDDTLHVTESLLISNPSSFVISPKDDQTPLLQFLLDTRATNVSFNEFSDSQYLKLADGKLNDWQSIQPGGVHQIVFNYDLPFEGEQSIELVAPISVISTMVMVENQDNSITCTGMQPADEQMASGNPLQVFSGMNTPANTKQELHCFNRNEIFPLIISIGALAFALLVVLLIAVKTRKKHQAAQHTKEKASGKATILDAIIALDDQYKNGDISAEVYRAKREELIRKLEGE